MHRTPAVDLASFLFVATGVFRSHPSSNFARAASSSLPEFSPLFSLSMSGATMSTSGVPFRRDNDDDARPKLPRHFIFGYGSLICPSSRSITAPSLKGRPAQPVLVRDVQRTWTARVGGGVTHHPRLTAMGVRCHRGARCSGVLIEVNDEELAMFDVRESGYDRVEVNAENVEGVPGLDDHEMHDGDHAVFVAGRRRRGGGGEEAPEVEVEAIEGRYVRDEDEEEENEVKVWMYVQREPIPADRVHPIAQSYVDIILRGCLTISRSFARSFLDTTHGWWNDGTEGDRINGGNAEAAEEGSIGDTKLPKSLTANERANDSDDGHHTWIDDRHDPLYVRADSKYSSAMGETIDGLINDHHPEALRKRRMYRASEHALPAAEKDPEEFD